jgi:hypothetical protein
MVGNQPCPSKGLLTRPLTTEGREPAAWNPERMLESDEASGFGTHGDASAAWRFMVEGIEGHVAVHLPLSSLSESCALDGGAWPPFPSWVTVTLQARGQIGMSFQRCDATRVTETKTMIACTASGRIR